MFGLYMSQTHGGNDKMPLIKEGGLHTCIPIHVVCILMDFRPKNEPNNPYGHPNDPGILLIPKQSNP